MLHHLASERLVLDDEVPFDRIWRFVTHIPVEGESWITPFLAVETPRVPSGELDLTAHAHHPPSERGGMDLH